jgi:hypothetical protein
MRLGLSLLLIAGLVSCNTVQPGASASNALIDRDAQARVFLDASLKRSGEAPSARRPFRPGR